MTRRTKRVGRNQTHKPLSIPQAHKRLFSFLTQTRLFSFHTHTARTNGSTYRRSRGKVMNPRRDRPDVFMYICTHVRAHHANSGGGATTHLHSFSMRYTLTGSDSPGPTIPWFGRTRYRLGSVVFTCQTKKKKRPPEPKQRQTEKGKRKGGTAEG